MFFWLPILVPRPHPLTRRNGLVNQVEFFGLKHTFATESPCNVYPKPAQNRYGYSSRDNINCCKESIAFHFLCFCFTWRLPRPTRKGLVHTVCTCTHFLLYCKHQKVVQILVTLTPLRLSVWSLWNMSEQDGSLSSRALAHTTFHLVPRFRITFFVYSVFH